MGLDESQRMSAACRNVRGLGFQVQGMLLCGARERNHLQLIAHDVWMRRAPQHMRVLGCLEGAAARAAEDVLQQHGTVCIVAFLPRYPELEQRRGSARRRRE
jgi:hypothetical protein